MKRALLAFLCATLAVVGGSVLLLGRAEPAQRAEESVTTLLEVCSGSEDCVRERLGPLLKDRGPGPLAEEILEAFRAQPDRRPGCHALMHELGRQLAQDVIAGDAPALGDLWQICGAGIIHGAFENLDLPASGTGAASLRTCNDPEFAVDRLLAACIHAVGHSLYKHHDGDVVTAGASCTEGAAEVAFPSLGEQTTVNACLQGLYMLDRDERFRTRSIPVTNAEWESSLPHCAEPSVRAGCVMSYSSVAVRGGEAAGLSYATWCTEGSGRADRCLYLLGQDATFLALDGTSPGAVGVCIRAEKQVRAEFAGSCLDGVRNAMQAVGTPPGEVRERICRIDPELDPGCAD